MEEFSLCHGKSTQEKQYEDPVLSKAKAVMGQDWYRQQVAPQVNVEEEEQQSAALKRIEAAHALIEEQIEEDTIREIVMAEKGEEVFVPKRSSDNKLLIFGPHVKEALLDAILKAAIGQDGKGIKGLGLGLSDELYAAGSKVKNPIAVKCLLRMMCLHHEEWWSVKILRVSLLTFVSNLDP